jgi:hypothetical protein
MADLFPPSSQLRQLASLIQSSPQYIDIILSTALSPAVSLDGHLLRQTELKQRSNNVGHVYIV